MNSKRVTIVIELLIIKLFKHILWFYMAGLKLGLKLFQFFQMSEVLTFFSREETLSLCLIFYWLAFAAAQVPILANYTKNK